MVRLRNTHTQQGILMERETKDTVAYARRVVKEYVRRPGFSDERARVRYRWGATRTVSLQEICPHSNVPNRFFRSIFKGHAADGAQRSTKGTGANENLFRYPH